MESKLDVIIKKLKEKNALIMTEMDEVKDITIPQVSFSKGNTVNCVRVRYISDLHLEQHLIENGIQLDDKERVTNYIDGIIKQMIGRSEAILSSGVTSKKVAEIITSGMEEYLYIKYLYRHLSNDEFEDFYNRACDGLMDDEITPILINCIVFTGDISTHLWLIKLFFERFWLRVKFFKYKEWKRNYGCINDEREGLCEAEACKEYEQTLQNYIEEREKTFHKIIRLEGTIGKKLYRTYKNKETYEIRRLIEARKDVPDYAYYLIRDLKGLDDIIKYTKEKKADIIASYMREYHLQIDLKIKDFCPIFYVLGNHEYVEFDTVEQAVNVFREVLAPQRITVLQNEILEFNNCILCAGTGFAQYNKEYNADTLICAKQMMHNRRYEIEESQLFESKYTEALALSKQKNIPLIVLSHYPVKDWLSSKTDGVGYYFSGHTHNNMIFVSENGSIYADNQVGYKSEDFRLKRYPIGTIYNPFISYKDGFYRVTPQQYQDFYLYSGESVGVGLIEKAINNNNDFYMIKRNGFYGFFLINDKRTQICAGGRPKNISEITDIEYFYNCFNLMIYQYVTALKPYRDFQTRISDELKKLDIPSYNLGRIHGCIVDVDFYHHIMINPAGEGKITFYYSPVFGLVQEKESFEKLLDSMEAKDERLFKNKTAYLESKKSFLCNENYILPKLSQDTLIGEYDNKLVAIDISSSIYKASRRINQLQRLFSSNILRDWDNSLVGEIIHIENVDDYVADKQLSDYNLVQKHWKNLRNIPSEQIDLKLVKCALNSNRKCRFPKLDYERKYGRYWGINPMDAEGIVDYINHIPKNVLRETVDDFHSCLNKNLLKYYPLDCISGDELDRILSYYTGRELLEVLDYIGPEWPEEFGKHVAKAMNQKNRPTYCDKDLWEKIRSYD